MEIHVIKGYQREDVLNELDNFLKKDTAIVNSNLFYDNIDEQWTIGVFYYN